jgi:hypothetical protein
MEIWKPVVGHEQFYEVSSEGNFRSLPREVFMATHSEVRGGNPINPYPKGKYLYVSLRIKQNNIACLGAHTMVCAAFHGTKPTPQHVCNHKNGNKYDNRADNLEWMTVKENAEHAVKVLDVYRRGVGHPSSKLSENDVQKIRSLSSSGASYGTLARRFDVSKQTIQGIVLRRAWTHVA